MSTFRRFKPKLALTKMMKEAGGMYAVEALRRADENLGELREGCLVNIDDVLDRLDAMAKAGIDTGPDFETAYGLSSQIIGLSGGAPELKLEEAARSLCDYLDRLAEGERLDLRGIGVHVSALRLLHRSPAGPQERRTILDGLAQVAAHMGG